MIPNKHTSDIRKSNVQKEEIKICAKLNGVGGFGFAADYMVFDSSMPEFEDIKHAFMCAIQKYLARVDGDIQEHERKIFEELQRKFTGNNMLKTYEEIVEKCRDPFSRFGHDIDVYLNYLPYEYAEEFLIGKYDCITWDLNVKKLFEENIFCTMKKYMDFDK